MKKTVLILIMIMMMTVTTKAESPYDVYFDSMTEQDYIDLCRVVYLESAIADCPMTVNVAVVETVLNRCMSDEFPNTIGKVLRQKGQFCLKEVPVRSEKAAEAIEFVRVNGKTVLPDYDYCFFATKKQSLGKDHIWIGGRHSDGRPLKGKGMYYCRER